MSPPPARLLSVRLQGFKSFAERTLVTFGPGISAVVGPNGSGKSNLADALRWALGEQGRALRSRKSEDVIWAGSERRSAVGMADVQLTLDNADSLLPVEFGIVELGRRLYRSGENEYQLNRQRVRLRDLVDLLDAAHLAENAFLFIGQGMVDQALALRPEERRPLFEEVAGVRRHERRRRRAEDQLAESEANLARVEDIVAELRPQVRRLAAQAEQQAARTSVGDELVLAILAAAHGRWHEGATRIAHAEATLAEARAGVDAALAALERLESDAAAAAATLDDRAATAARLRVAADDARTALTEAQLEDGRLAAELGAAARDRERMAGERAAAEADLVVQRRRLAEPVPARDEAIDAEVAAAERDLATGLAELATLQAADRAHAADAAAVRRAEAVRNEEQEAARRRAHALDRQVTEASERLARARAEESAAAATLEQATGATQAAAADEAQAAATRESAARALEAATAADRAAADRAAQAAAAVATLRARHEALSAALADPEGSVFAARMRERGARRLDEAVSVDPGLRDAVDAALADAGRAYLARRAAVLEHAGGPGLAAVIDGDGNAAPGDASDVAADRLVSALLDRARALGGGPLREAVRADGTGLVSRILATAVWTPDLASALELQGSLPVGWTAVTRDGSAVVGPIVVRLQAASGTMVRRAELERVELDLHGAERAAAEASEAAARARAAHEQARAELERARAAAVDAEGRRRQADDSERATARRHEGLLREAAWLAAQVERLEAEAVRARAAVPEEPASPAVVEDGSPPAAIETWQARVRELRARRDRLVATQAEADARRHEAERRRAAADAAAMLDEQRVAAIDEALAGLAAHSATLAAQRDALAERLAAARVRDAEARSALAAVLAADGEDRARLGQAERALGAARDALRAAEDAARQAEHHDLEARLGLEGLREQLLVELAGLGPLALRHLPPGRSDAASEDPGAIAVHDGPSAEGSADDGGSEEAVTLARALERAATGWVGAKPPEDPPTPGRLATLRRRYHELGAANPMAVEEYAEQRARLEELETQAGDLRSAIEQTRALIAELDTMISSQFRTTFAALEGAFDARFQQLFGGGFAKLSLTDPSDLASTGIEIVARPPGKKPQALAMLSGGERALTAVALLFAMLEVRPVPFCVLDEVDAALDEANVGRFTDALRDLAAATQFIVITHNRGTIEIADALYGVTVGDDSVSRVISLRLDEATAIADRMREPAGVGPAAG